MSKTILAITLIALAMPAFAEPTGGGYHPYFPPFVGKMRKLPDVAVKPPPEVGIQQPKVRPKLPPKCLSCPADTLGQFLKGGIAF